MGKRIARLEEVLDMTIPSWQSRKIIVEDNDNFQRRRALMLMSDVHLKKAISDERMRVIFLIPSLSHERQIEEKNKK